MSEPMNDCLGASAIGLSKNRCALRKSAQDPWFTALAVLAMALGIGANTAVFSVVTNWRRRI
jgi:hypothetical protein